jgi:hypothetical protein
MSNSAVLKADVGGGGAMHNSVTVNMTCQEAELWCWAAVTQAVEAFRGNVVTQEDVATGHVGHSQPGVTCSVSDPVDGASRCAKICAGSCNSPHILSNVLAERGRLTAVRQVTPSFADITQAIDASRPVPVRIRIDTGAGGGHFICVVGYSDDGQGNQFVDVMDPLVPGVGLGAASVQNVPFTSFVGGNYDVNGEQGTPNFIYEVS